MNYVHGLGVIVGSHRIAIGWGTRLSLELPNASSCRLIVLVQRPSQLARVKALLRTGATRVAHACIVPMSGVAP